MLKKNTIKQANLLDTTQEKNELLEYLKSKYPQSISENKPNIESLMRLLGLNTKERGYELNFTGKPLANALYSTKSIKEFKLELPIVQNSAQNIIIKGDNLDALKLLKYSYYEKIKMIYIDPPYNTKTDNFIYCDDFRDDFRKILLETGLLEIDEEGKEIESESLRFFRSITRSRSHSGWLSFMLPRLKLARDLLREDGVIFISIDDNEQANLKILCDEIFGEENFVADFIRKTKSTTNDAKTGLNYQHEFLLCYAKDKENINLLGGQKDLSKYSNPDNDPNGEWISSDPSAKSGTPQNGYFGVTNPYTGKVDYPPEGRFWRFSQNTIQKHIDEGRICFKKGHKEDERGFIYKRYLKDLKTNLKTFDSLKFVDNKFMNQSATKGLKELNMVEAFSYPKSVEFIQEIINHATTDNGDIILDFFAGSGTTAHAVMAQNAIDGGNRKFILVQLDDPINESKSKVAYDFCKNELGSQNPVISDITIERVRRAGEKIKEAHKDRDINIDFKVFNVVNKPCIISDEDNELQLMDKSLSPYERAINLSVLDGKMLHLELKELIKDSLYQCEQSIYIVANTDEVCKYLKDKTESEMVYINGYDIEKLEFYLNLENFLQERLRVVY